MSILVTGHRGFIGSHVCANLEECGVDYTYMDFSRLSENSCNIQDAQAVTFFMQKHRPTHVLHLAWSTSRGYTQCTENIDFLAASLHLVNAFYACGGQRFVGVGSCFEYGPTEDRCNEQTTPTCPATLYGKAKLTLANYLQAYATCYGLSWAWCRPFYIAGPGESPHRLVPTACISLLQGEDFVVSSPYNILDYMDIRDVSGALVKVLLSDFCGNINIGSGDGRTVLELLQALQVIIGGKGQLLCNCEAKAPVKIIADVSLLNEQFEFAGRHTIHETLTACYAYWSNK